MVNSRDEREAESVPVEVAHQTARLDSEIGCSGRKSLRQTVPLTSFFVLDALRQHTPEVVPKPCA